MRHGSLFSGIGGFDLAAEWMGWENIFQVEIDKFCQKVLTKNFPNVTKYKDIKEFDGTKYRGAVDVISGGFPCQPFSNAGKRKGESDDRYLWPEYLRIIREIQPAYVVGENVAGLLSMEDGKTLDRILFDLESEGYETEQFIIPACGIGAWHRRDRIWICCHSNNNGSFNLREPIIKGIKNESQGKVEQLEGSGKNVPDTNNKRLEREKSERFRSRESGLLTKCNQWDTEPSVGRVANGIPGRVDRLKGLGNAIVPQVAYEIFKAIETINNN